MELIDQRSAGGKIHQKIDIALFIILPACNAPENGERDSLMTRSHP